MPQDLYEAESEIEGPALAEDYIRDHAVPELTFFEAQEGRGEATLSADEYTLDISQVGKLQSGTVDLEYTWRTFLPRTPARVRSHQRSHCSRRLTSRRLTVPTGPDQPAVGRRVARPDCPSEGSGPFIVSVT